MGMRGITIFSFHKTLLKKNDLLFSFGIIVIRDKSRGVKLIKYYL